MSEKVLVSSKEAASAAALVIESLPDRAAVAKYLEGLLEEWATFQVAPEAPPVVVADTSWGFADSEDSGDPYCGSFATREECITEARATYDEDFWILEGRQRPASAYVSYSHEVDRILEGMGEMASEVVGEAAESFADISKADREELATVLSNAIGPWLDAHVPVTFWEAVGEPEKIAHDPHADVDTREPCPGDCP